jgi:hypothetical protein
MLSSSMLAIRPSELGGQSEVFCGQFLFLGVF